MNPILSVVVPVYAERGNIGPFLDRCLPILEAISHEFEVIFALDPSTDGTEEIILERRARDPRVKLLRFSRRIGQPMATLAGLHYSSGEAVIVMDVDLQDPPELIAGMVAKWREGFDVVMAQRRRREGETLVKRFVAYWGYRVINAVAEVPIPPNTGDFRLLSRRVVEEIKKLKEHHGFLRGLVAIVGFKQTAILFDRPPRHSGKGNYNRWLGSLRIGLNGLICFSSALLSLMSKIGILLASFAMVLGVACVALKLTGFPLPMGFATVIFAVLFMGGIQLVSVGVLGEYIARIYDEVKDRPKFIVDRVEGFPTGST